MSTFKTYIYSMPMAARHSFAQACGTSWLFLRNVAYGHSKAGEKLSVAIERESRGAVTRKDLRPDDWHEIWPELAERQE